MTFQAFHLSMMKHPVLGKLLPLECRRTYPVLTREGDALCAAFVGFRMRPAAGGAEAQAPAYYLKITYPQCALRAFVRFQAPGADWRPMTPRDPEEMRQLGALCDQILEAWDKQSGELDAALARYGDLLRRSLEPAQLEVLDGLAQLEHRG